jgi:hypothetical protein
VELNVSLLLSGGGIPVIFIFTEVNTERV